MARCVSPVPAALTGAIAVAAVLALCPPAHAVGESAVITLVFPYGTAGTGMAETGTSIADDVSAPFYNPALLGLCNPRWFGGEVSWFYEPILPAFGISDLWHTTVAGCYQPRVPDFGAFGMYINYLNFGMNTWTDELGREMGKARSREYIIAGSWGLALGRPGEERNAVGISVKYVYSALAPGFGPGSEGVGRTFAVDAGYVYRAPFGLRAAVAFLNMGPAIFYISRDEADPIPFCIDLAVGFDRSFDIVGLKMLRVRAEYRLSREIVKNYIDQRPDPFWKAIWTDLLNDTAETWADELSDDVIHHWGVEVTGMNTFSMRWGFMEDPAGHRRELTMGLGVKFLNHFQINYSNIIEPGRSDRVRTGQWRIDMSYFRMFYWPVQDLTWWEAGCD